MAQITFRVLLVGALRLFDLVKERPASRQKRPRGTACDKLPVLDNQELYEGEALFDY